MVRNTPLHCTTRDKLAFQFKEILLLYQNVNLTIVEIVYGNKHFKITDKHNTNHAQLITSNDTILQQKENMLNNGVKRLLQDEPDDKNICFTDCGTHFDNPLG